MAKRGRKKRAELDYSLQPSILPLKSDIVFKMVFADKRNVDILRNFLAAALGIPEDVFEKIEVIDSHLEKEYPDDKLGILDVRAMTESGKHIDIEIQLMDFPSMSERITFYTCKNLTSQISAGNGYAALRKTITIAIFDFPLLSSPPYQHKFTLYDARNDIQFTDVMEIHTLELPKLPAEGDDEEGPLPRWLRLFKAQGLEECEMLAAKDPTIKKTVNILKRISSDDKARMAYEYREKARRDEYAKMQGAFSKGRLEGSQETQIKYVKNLLAEGASLDLIARISGLSLEEIQAMSDS